MCVTACIQGRDFIVARWKEWKDQGRVDIGFGQKKWEKDRSVTILYLGKSHCKPDLERKLNSLQWAKIIFWDILLPTFRQYCRLLVLRSFYICFSPYSKFPLCLNLCVYQRIDVRGKRWTTVEVHEYSSIAVIVIPTMSLEDPALKTTSYIANKQSKIIWKKNADYKASWEKQSSGASRAFFRNHAQEVCLHFKSTPVQCTTDCHRTSCVRKCQTQIVT